MSLQVPILFHVRKPRADLESPTACLSSLTFSESHHLCFCVVGKAVSDTPGVTGHPVCSEEPLMVCKVVISNEGPYLYFTEKDTEA